MLYMLFVLDYQYTNENERFVTRPKYRLLIAASETYVAKVGLGVPTSSEE